MIPAPISPDQYAAQALAAGCPRDQIENFTRAGLVLQPRQLSASAAARLCDKPDGPTAVGFGGARGGGKSHWLLAQLAADDCQRQPELKCLLVRKSGKSNRENVDDLSRRILRYLPHAWSASSGLLTFENGSRIYVKHYQHEREIDAYLGLEYDAIAVEEATTLTARKYDDLLTCARTSKPAWRPRVYTTTNPGGVGHEWYRLKFVVPYERQTESVTRFIPARVEDNRFTNREYQSVLANCTGWQREAWYKGNWNIAAGQFFKNFRPDIHVLEHFDYNLAKEWFAAMDYGYTHYTVMLLGCVDEQDNLYVIDEYARREGLPKEHLLEFKKLLQRNRLFVGHIDDPADLRNAGEAMRCRIRHDPSFSWRLLHLAAGGDLFSQQYDGSIVARQFRQLGCPIRPAKNNRVQGWAEILDLLGDPANGIPPRLFIHKRCSHLLNTLPYLQHDPDHPADVLKINTDEEGLGGDDAADALRYLVATPRHRSYVVPVRGL